MFSAQVLVHGLKVLVTFCLKQKENEATIGGTRSRLRQDGGTGVGQGGGTQDIARIYPGGIISTCSTVSRGQDYLKDHKGGKNLQQKILVYRSSMV